ncbi:glutaredoxin-C9-like [Humulus lupulus]|uniref:glutaredoxin-C9-like n=1 Tax=Humulus lupulus TaxID=3486 RepID=UPI002B400DF0|nr:glutaredoxin-C9-like [Humulus lupulus]
MQQAIPYKSWPPLHHTTPLSRLPAVVMETSISNSNDGVNVNSSGSSSSKGVLTFRRSVVDVNALNGLVTDNAVMVFVRRGCCMGHVVKHLLLGHGVNPAVYEVDEAEEVGLVKELETIAAGDSGKALPPAQFPAVFIGGKFFGGLDRVMAAHISGELVPLLKEAGALWL